MIYTKKGDKGVTGLYGTKKRVSKSSKLIRVLGSIDEANSFLGTVSGTKNIQLIQKNLMKIGSIIAGAKTQFLKDETTMLEKSIDRFEATLPPLTNFILPTGKLMFARSLVRRAEREVISLKSSFVCKSEVLRYLNRLSDYLFVLSRWENLKSKKKEIIWKTV